LVRGLSEVARVKPSSDKLEVVEWFGKWLLENNPTNPIVESPSSVSEKEKTKPEE